MVAVGATVMMVSILVLYCFLTFTDYTPNENIILNDDQRNHIILFILTPLYFAVLLASAVFHATYNQNKSSTLRCYSCANATQSWCCACSCTISPKAKKIIATGTVLILTIGVLGSGFVSMPTGSSRVHVVLRPSNGEAGVVLTGYTKAQVTGDKACVRNETAIRCGGFFLQTGSSGEHLNTITTKNSIFGKEFKDMDILVGKDFKTQCLTCNDTKDNFCHRKLYKELETQKQVSWSEWGPWSDCSSTCGVTEQTRNRTLEAPISGEGTECRRGPETQTKECIKPTCVSRLFTNEVKEKGIQYRHLGVYVEDPKLFGGRPSFRQRDTLPKESVYLFWHSETEQWQVSPGKLGRDEAVLRNPRPTARPPNKGWQYYCKNCNETWQNSSTLSLLVGTIKPCKEVKIELLGDTKETVQGLWNRKFSGYYSYNGDWVVGRPVYYKEKDYSEEFGYYLATLPGFDGKWGFSVEADATYAYIASKEKTFYSPGDVDIWRYYAGHQWKETEGAVKWPEGNITSICTE